MNEFEKRLQRICEEDTEYDVLWAQWVYDKRLLTRALQSVGVLFPHYSLHDASHSATILRQLARVLGTSRIEQLSPTDLWLLLEAAYLHDIGMVVAETKRREWWNESAFKVHLTKLTGSSDEGLREAAELLAHKASIEALSGEWPFEVQRALILVMADYARAQHPRLAEQIVSAPDLIGLESPRTKLIPHRAIQLLGKICRHHGSNFDKMFDLPQYESGYGTDEAHPRFIACMLRLGDLLDLDDGRFCPVLTSTFGTLPSSSLAHERKHASIEHLLVSPTRIEVEAICEDHEAFDEAERWLNWLRNELRDQAARWSEIVPANGFGALPSTGRIAARLKGGFIFEDGRRPLFEVDREAITNLVRGANLYDRPVSFIRELLQNAVDATLLRVWNERRDEILRWEHDVKTQDDVLNRLRKLLTEYPIIVEIRRKESLSEKVGQDGTLVHVSIDDQGLGISQRDIRYLQSIGGSRNNQRKQERKQGMPEWMKPSGIFGIGLQSVFLFAEEVTLTTRADDEFESMAITLRRGQKESAGQILVKPLTGREARKTPGTRIECEIILPSIPDYVSGITSHGEVGSTLANFDAVKDSVLPHEVAAARDQVRLFARDSFCTIRLNEEPLPGSPIFDFKKTASDYFDKHSNIEIKNLRASKSSLLEVRYRGVETNERRRKTLLRGEVDLHFGSADKLLMLSREKFRRDATMQINEAIDVAFQHIFPRYYKNLLAKSTSTAEHEEELAAASLFAELFGEGCIPSQKSCGRWRQAKWISGASLGDIASADVIELLIDPRPQTLESRRHEEHVEMTMEGNRSFARVYTKELSIDLTSWLWALTSRSRKVVFAVKKTNATGEPDGIPYEILRLVRETEDTGGPVDGDTALKSILGKLRYYFGIGYRSTIPCPREFSRLEFNGLLPYAMDIAPLVYPRMVSPFCEVEDKITTPNLEDVVRWTTLNTGSQQVRELLEMNSIEAHRNVANELMRFLRRADALMQAEWATKRAYDLTEALWELRKAFGREVEG